MARVLVAAQTTPGAYPELPITADSVDLQMQEADDSLGNYTPLVEGKTLVIVQNTNVAAQTVTFTSTADTLNRVGDISAYSVDPDELAMFGPFRGVGWAHSGQLWIDCSDSDVKIAVITLP